MENRNNLLPSTKKYVFKISGIKSKKLNRETKVSFEINNVHDKRTA